MQLYIMNDMKNVIINRGHDEQIILKLYHDEDKQVPVNIDSLTDLEVRISIGNNIIDQWNKAGSGDFKPLQRTDAYNYFFYLETDNTTLLGHTDFWIEVKEANVILSDSIDNSISSEPNLFNIVPKPY